MQKRKLTLCESIEERIENKELLSFLFHIFPPEILIIEFVNFYFEFPSFLYFGTTILGYRVFQVMRMFQNLYKFNASVSEFKTLLKSLHDVKPSSLSNTEELKILFGILNQDEDIIVINTILNIADRLMEFECSLYNLMHESISEFENTTLKNWTGYQIIPDSNHPIHLAVNNLRQKRDEFSRKDLFTLKNITLLLLDSYVLKIKLFTRILSLRNGSNFLCQKLASVAIHQIQELIKHFHRFQVVMKSLESKPKLQVESKVRPSKETSIQNHPDEKIMLDNGLESLRWNLMKAFILSNEITNQNSSEDSLVLQLKNSVYESFVALEKLYPNIAVEKSFIREKLSKSIFPKNNISENFVIEISGDEEYESTSESNQIHSTQSNLCDKMELTSQLSLKLKQIPKCSYHEVFEET